MCQIFCRIESVEISLKHLLLDQGILLRNLYIILMPKCHLIELNLLLIVILHLPTVPTMEGDPQFLTIILYINNQKTALSFIISKRQLIHQKEQLKGTFPFSRFSEQEILFKKKRVLVSKRRCM